MKPSDDPILEFIEHVGEVTPSVIARNVDLHRKYVSRRLRELVEYSVVETSGDGFYRVTELGEQYLAGDLDASELEKEEGED